MPSFQQLLSSQVPTTKNFCSSSSSTCKEASTNAGRRMTQNWQPNPAIAWWFDSTQNIGFFFLLLKVADPGAPFLSVTHPHPPAPAFAVPLATAIYCIRTYIVNAWDLDFVPQNCLEMHRQSLYSMERCLLTEFGDDRSRVVATRKGFLEMLSRQRWSGDRPIA